MLLVTGASGYVGQALCAELIKNNIEFLHCGRSNKNDLIQKFFIPTDLSKVDLEWTRSFKQITQIVHLAAAVPHSSEYPDNFNSKFITNTIDKNIYNLQKINNCRVIYFSSCGLYSKTQVNFHAEEAFDSLVARTPYYQAKIDGEELFSSNGKHLIFRLSAPVGKTVQPGLVLDKMIKDAVRLKQILVHDDGIREQDFISNIDVTKAIVQVLRVNISGTYNLCSSNPVAMKSLAKLIAKCFEKVDVTFLSHVKTPNENMSRYDNQKLKNAIDWAPTLNIEQIIANIMEHTRGKN